MTLIELSGGLVVREAAIVMGCQLEARGHTLSVIDGTLGVTPRSGLTDEDIATITAHKAHLMALAEYVAP